MKKWLLILAFFLFACTNEDDYLFDESESRDISVLAKMALDLDSINNPKANLVVTPDDSIIFFADVKPSKSIRMQKYYWTLDDNFFASEFNFRKSIQDPGPHTVTFSLIDFFGDTISDTLHIWVGRAPILNDSLFIPSTKAHNIPFFGGISFSWSAFDPDSICPLHYKFMLTDIDHHILIDTIIYQNHFTYPNSINPSSRYNWSVRAYNDIGMEAKKTISSHFFTKGVNNEGAIIAYINTSAQHSSHFVDLRYAVSLVDSNNQVIKKDTLVYDSRDNAKATFHSISAGKYKLAAQICNYSDYQNDTLSFSIKPNEVLELDTLHLLDTIPPTIEFDGAKGDTIDYADTLVFTILDGGTTSSKTTLQTFLNGSFLNNQKLGDGKYLVELPQTAKSWQYTLLTLVATDISHNEIKKTYYIKPSESLFECNIDTTLYDDEILDLFVIDHNPYMFIPEYFYFDIPIEDGPITVVAGNSTSHHIQIVSSLFKEEENHLRTGVQYSNGFTTWRNWTVHRKFSKRGDNEE